MNKTVKAILGVACIALLTLGSVSGQTTVTVDPNAPAGWIGYMNVWSLPGSGSYPPNLGGYIFGEPWGTAALCANFAGPVLTLSPNSVNDSSSFWYISTSSPSIANVLCDASMYVQNDSLAGQTVTFTGDVLSDTLTLANNPGNVNPLGDGWTSVVFIKDFNASYSLVGEADIPIAPGDFSISLATNPGDHIQYGFETIGPCVWATDPTLPGYGNIEIIPEPSSIGLVLTGLIGLVPFVWKRRS